ncbi:hypothetical protein [uncultured Thiodictyon sp.]|uniref:hypothetical protein n=1 Tax=uncultured Thiodictyon sp. TaxID=1846217 RepID=UPI0025D20A3C|nr:hypothetical protein [uncultured Thiodictyon sp.]
MVHLCFQGHFGETQSLTDFTWCSHACLRPEIAKASGLTQEALYRALRENAQPRFDTINRVCHALGVKLVAQPLTPV